MSSGFSRGPYYALAGALCATLHAGPALARAGEKDADASTETTSSSEGASEADRDAARKLALEALDLMETKRWQEAHVKLERAYGLFRAPTVAVLSARALENIGKLIEARNRYQEAAETPIDKESPKPFRKAVKEAKREAERLMKEIPKLVLRVEGAEPQQVRVEVDGQLLATELLGRPMELNPGEHTVKGRLREDENSDPEFGLQKFTLEREETRDLTLTFIVEPPKPEAPPPTTPAPSEPGNGLAWLSLGVGAAGLATGVASGVVMLNAKSRLDKNCTSTCPGDQRSNLDRFRTARNVSFVGYSVGLVGLGLGVALLVQSAGSDSSPVVAIGDGGAQLGYWGKF